MRTVAWFMVGVAAFLAVAAFVYAATSGEEAGSVMLLLAAGLAVMIGGYLLTVPGADGGIGAEGPEGAAEADEYLPSSSIWPFWVGLGGVVLANGVALGLWGLIPGGILSAVGVVGFARQSRRRD